MLRASRLLSDRSLSKVHGRVLDARKERRKVPYPDETGGTADGMIAERKMCSGRLVRSKISLLRSKGALLLIRPGARKRPDRERFNEAHVVRCGGVSTVWR